MFLFALGTAFDFGFWKVLIKRILIALTALVVAALLVLILFVKPGVLVA